ncbi:MAG: TetR/AcrR family transcriptional regulator C-terminal domain-containing protein [Ruminococcus sp.]|nr:TetR/AcrR family transcriptional regulator C-terminal domain-containing protein [Ruminococcus sp.]
MANFTEEAIKKSFMELLNKKPVNKITIKEIAKDCDINRNSFYYHFNDLPDLIEVILTEEAERFISLHKESEDIYLHLVDAVDFAIENKTAVYHIYNSANREMFERYLDRIAEKTVSDYMEYAIKDKNISDDDREALVLYYRCLLIGFVINWLGTGMKYDLKQKIKRICELFDGAMNTAIDRCEIERKNC